MTSSLEDWPRRSAWVLIASRSRYVCCRWIEIDETTPPPLRVRRSSTPDCSPRYVSGSNPSRCEGNAYPAQSLPSGGWETSLTMEWGWVGLRDGCRRGRETLSIRSTGCMRGHLRTWILLSDQSRFSAMIWTMRSSEDSAASLFRNARRVRRAITSTALQAYSREAA